MAKIDFCFSGWVRGAEISKATDVNGKDVDVSNMPPNQLVQALDERELFISLADNLDDNKSCEIEIFDFDETDVI